MITTLPFTNATLALAQLNIMKPIKQRYFVRVTARANTHKYTVTLYLRIKCGGQPGQIMLSTGITCNKAQFLPAQQAIKGNDLLNEALQAKRLDVVKLIHTLELQQNCNIDTIKEALTKHTVGKATFGGIVESFLIVKQQSVKHSTFLCLKAGLKTFLEKTGLANKIVENISPADLEKALYKAKEHYLTGSFAIELAYLCAAVARAVMMGVIDKNPFDRIDKRTLKRGNKKRVRNIPKAADIAPETFKYDKAVKVQLQTAVSFCDLKNLSPDDFLFIGNQIFIVKKRQKTGQEFAVPITPEVKEIIESGDLKKLAYQNYWTALKKQNITSHLLRHARAREALNTGVPIEAVSRMLGHADVGMTLKYAPIAGREFSPDEVQKLMGE